TPEKESLPAWSPVRSPRHELRLIAANIKAVGLCWARASVLSITFVLGYVLLSESVLTGWSRRWVYVVGTLLLYPAGYVLITVEERYLWVTALLLLVLAAFVVNAVFLNRYLSAFGRWLLVVLSTASFL